MLKTFVLIALVAGAAATNPTHYGNPATGCESDEQSVQVQGVSGDFCSPSCTSGACPSDKPSGVTAAPQCALQSPTGAKYCALICSPSTDEASLRAGDAQCGAGACQSVQGVGLCTYAASSLDEQFEQFKKDFKKQYATPQEEANRKQAFAETLARVEELRTVEDEATFGVNKFADLRPEEFSLMHMGYRRMNKVPDVAVHTHELEVQRELKSFDWRSKSPSPVTPVKDQGQCGSCWAFSATEGIEAAWILSGKSQVVLAPQEIVSCDTVDLGCNGGDLPTAFKFVESISTPRDVGQTLNKEYPYTSGTTGASGVCKKKEEKDGTAPVTTFAYAIPPCQQGSCNAQAKKEKKMAEVLTQKGPLSICLDASPWQTYTGGILKTQQSCPGGAMDMDHCVQAVGFNTDGPTPYWIVRNSWNTDWGNDGYIYLAMNKNICGVANEAMFVNGE